MSRYTFDNGYDDCYDDGSDSQNNYENQNGFFGKNGVDEQDLCPPCHKKREYRCFKEIPCPCAREERPYKKYVCPQPCNDQEEQGDDDCARITPCQRCRCACLFPCLFCGRKR